MFIQSSIMNHLLMISFNIWGVCFIIKMLLFHFLFYFADIAFTPYLQAIY